MKNNLNNRYDIIYNRPHNPNHTKWQNAVRDIATVSVWGKAEAEAKVAELKAQGYTVKAYTGTGRRVEL